MEIIILSIKVIHVIVSLLLILVVLLQPGKSGDLGSIFGGGTSESIFGSSGAVPFLVKVTRGLAVLFLLSSLTLGYFAMSGGPRSVVSDVPAPAGEAVPADTGAGDVNTGDADTGTGTDANASGEADAPAPETQDTKQGPGDTTAPADESGQGQDP